MKRTFRVLLIDDNRDVLERVQRDLRGTVSVKGTPLEITVEVTPLHVELTRQSTDRYAVSMPTLQALAKACAKPFDFIFADFAFIGDSGKNATLRQILLDEHRGATMTDISGWVLSLTDIIEEFNRATQNGINATTDLPALDINFIKNNFIGHKGQIQVYTNSPPPFNTLFEEPALGDRDNEVRRGFRGATLGPLIRLDSAFGISEAVDTALKRVQGQLEFYTVILSRQLEWIITRNALDHMVRSSKWLRVTRAGGAFTKLTLFSIGLGTGVALLGEVDYHLLKDSFAPFEKSLPGSPSLVGFWEALIFIAFNVVLVSVIGVLYSWYLERKIGALLDRDEQS